MYPAIPPKHLTGQEMLMTPDGEAVSRLIDFWSWAYSDLIGNAERGALAEYIVACALDIQHTERISWDKYDLITKDGITIEVKTSGYLQTWEQASFSKLVFGIQPTYVGTLNPTNMIQNKRDNLRYMYFVYITTKINPLLILC